LAIDKAAGVTYKDDAILGRSFVLAKKNVKDAVVPVGFVDTVRIGGVTGWSGRRRRIRLGSARNKRGRRRPREFCVGSELGTGFQRI
jgi:hypothetical protein